MFSNKSTNIVLDQIPDGTQTLPFIREISMVLKDGGIIRKIKICFEQEKYFRNMAANKKNECGNKKLL